MSGGMLIPPGPVRVVMAMKPVVFRKGAVGFAALVKEQLGFDPFASAIHYFRSSRVTHLTVQIWQA